MLEQVGGDAQAFRIGRRVPEAPRVGEDARVDALGRVAAERMPQPLDDLVRQDADRSRLGIDVVQVAERLGGDVVIEVEQHAPPRRRRHVGAQPIGAPRVGSHGHVVRRVRRKRLGDAVGAGEEAEVVGQLVGIVDGDLAPHLAQRTAQRERAAQRVAVGAAMHGEQDASGSAQRLDGARQVLSRFPFPRVLDAQVLGLHATPARRTRALYSSSGTCGAASCLRASCSRTSRRSRSMRSPRSIVSS